MTDIALYLDPVCPFSWVTSRWLLDAAGAAVSLRQMSLAILNEGADLDEKHKRMMDRSRRLGRVFAAVTDKHGQEAFGALYDALGSRMHVRKDELTANAIDELLAECGLDESLTAALDDAGLDREVNRAHQASQEALGGTAGSPIIVIDGRGFHGPVLTGVPSHDDGVRLLDAILVAAKTPQFATLQRPTQGPPVLGEGPR